LRAIFTSSELKLGELYRVPLMVHGHSHDSNIGRKSQVNTRGWLCFCLQVKHRQKGDTFMGPLDGNWGYIFLEDHQNTLLLSRFTWRQRQIQKPKHYGFLAQENGQWPKFQS